MFSILSTLGLVLLLASTPLYAQEASAPPATAAVEQLLKDAALAADAGDAAKALGLADRALALAQQDADNAGEANAQRTRALQLAKLDRVADARIAWRGAETAWKRIGDGPGQVEALGQLAILEGAGQDERRSELLRQAIALAEQETKRPLAVVASLVSVGQGLETVTRLSEARQVCAVALTIAETAAPDSLEVAAALNALGLIAFSAADVSAAAGHHERALSIRQKLAPDSSDVALSLNNLGNAESRRGNVARARDLYERSLAINERLAPDSLSVASNLNNLGIVAWQRGELGPSREYQERALAIRERLAPGSRAIANSLNNLGLVAQRQGDLSAARDYHQRALVIREKLAPNSPELATTLNNLALAAAAEQDFAAARRSFERALAIFETIAANSLDVATILHNLGGQALDEGDAIAARNHYERAIAIKEKLAPQSLAMAEALNDLGLVLEAQGNLNAARDLFQRALAMKESLSPDSIHVALTLGNLGRIEDAQRNTSAATDYTSRAWAIVRAQGTVITGDEARQAYDSSYHSLGSQVVRQRVALGQIDEAFVTLEEGRAQSLLQLLAKRGVAQRLAPDAVWQAYQAAQSAQDRASDALEVSGEAEVRAKLELEAGTAQQVAESDLQEKRRLLTERQEATAKARQAYTQARVDAERRWADMARSIQTAVPIPIAPADARRAVPPDMIVCSFSLGEESSTLFLVTRDGAVRAFALPLPLKELTARVAFVRGSVSRDAGDRGLRLPGADAVRISAARELYQKLFPAEARQTIDKFPRILLSPDGVLWDLPFAALITNQQGTPQYLGLEKSLAYTQSLTIFADMRQAARPRAGKRSVVAIGNPLFDDALRQALPTGTRRQPQQLQAPVAPQARRALGELAALSRDGDIPQPLPYAEAEANDVAKLYGIRAFIGHEPTEAWFRRHAPAADIIHLATHGYFNPFRAISSGVRLAVPEQRPAPGETDNDGALQAWEVFSLQLQADLVVLSACETGLGTKVPGEGLVGLTRAFQVAGARSVVATEWRVSDRSTARAMVMFHQHLRSGMAKDEALRQAMRKIASDPTSADPYYWAPFVLFGDSAPLQ